MRNVASLLGLMLVVACGRSQSAPSAPSDGGAAGEPGLRAPGLAEPVKPDPASTEAAPDVDFRCRAEREPDAQMVRACILLTGCVPDWMALGGSTIEYAPVQLTLSDCIAYGVPEAKIPNDCALEATSCEDIGACFGSGFYAGKCPLEPKPGSFCDGSKLVDCNDVIPPQYLDCARVGAKCVEFDGDTPGADCVVDSPCSQDSQEDEAGHHCDGSKLVKCRGGRARGEDCALQSSTCVEDGTEAACAPIDVCTPEPTTCSSASGANYCWEDGRLHRLDCASAGLECHDLPEGDEVGIECRAPGCTPADQAACYEQCAGPVARLCVGGARFAVDCRDQGFATCNENFAVDGPAATCSVPSIAFEP